MRLSTISAAVLSASILFVSTTGVALAKHHAPSMKGENLKGEVAAPCPPPVMLKDGFYVGAQGGYDSYRVHAKTNADLYQATNHLSSTGWAGGLFIGYGKYLTDMFYLGGEAFGNYTGANGNNKDSVLSMITGKAIATHSEKFRVNGTYGLAVLPGVRLNDTTLAYVRLGYNWASMKTKTNDTYGFGLVDVHGKKNKTKGGFNYGLGMESLIVDDWSIRGEYTYTSYTSLKTPTTKFRAGDNEFMLGLIYHIA